MAAVSMAAVKELPRTHWSRLRATSRRPSRSCVSRV
ncbi:hypothetical protein CRE_23790 [Caenorhabditis remanei]|uniref:Uncharacterized protein n=1 Tax=Caenorhabditis remanei TaxID=31234 RepID=E3NMY1_CAERE|nr:hypothetical protein CRE_23790 [Caenorhabditis remanei]